MSVSVTPPSSTSATFPTGSHNVSAGSHNVSAGHHNMSAGSHNMMSSTSCRELLSEDQVTPRYFNGHLAKLPQADNPVYFCHFDCCIFASLRFTSVFLS